MSALSNLTANISVRPEEASREKEASHADALRKSILGRGKREPGAKAGKQGMAAASRRTGRQRGKTVLGRTAGDAIKD